MDGTYEAARDVLRRGVLNNPVNPELLVFLGDCERELGNKEAAKSCYYNAIYRCRPWTVPWVKLDQLLAEEGKQLRDLEFVDMTSVHEATDTDSIDIWIQIDPDVPEGQFAGWLGYSHAKAAWMYEILDSPEDVEVTSMEKYCVSHLLNAWESSKEEFPETEDLFFETLLEIVKDGVFTEYLFFDIVAPQASYTTALLPDELRAAIKAYFDKYCVQEIPEHAPRELPGGNYGGLNQEFRHTVWLNPPNGREEVEEYLDSLYPLVMGTPMGDYIHYVGGLQYPRAMVDDFSTEAQGMMMYTLFDAYGEPEETTPEQKKEKVKGRSKEGYVGGRVFGRMREELGDIMDFLVNDYLPGQDEEDNEHHPGYTIEDVNNICFYIDNNPVNGNGDMVLAPWEIEEAHKANVDDE
ncbi:MAG: hypothetical protein ABIE94_04495 [archaeon]